MTIPISVYNNNFTPHWSLQHANMFPIHNFDSNFELFHWDLDDNINHNNIYTRKIRFFPSEIQKESLSQMFGISRFVYNKCVENFKLQIHNNPNERLPTSFIFWKKLGFIQDKFLDQSNSWMKTLPSNSRVLSSKDFADSLHGAYKSLDKLNPNIINPFMKFKTRHNKTQTFDVDKRSFNFKDFQFFKTSALKRKSKFKTKRKINNSIKKIVKRLKKTPHDITILRENYNKYYFCIPLDRNIVNTKPEHHICGIDQGVRTFATTYSPNDGYHEIGKRKWLELEKHEHKIDKFKSLLDKHKNEDIRLSYMTRKHMWRRCDLLRTKVKNKVMDFHWKTANFLVRQYRYIILPPFNTKEMVNKMNRNIGRVTARAMIGLSHYKFKEKLLYKASCYRNRYVLTECHEKFTTKRCGRCGEIDNNMTDEKIYNCANCGYIEGRDKNASRNILIQNTSISRV